MSRKFTLGILTAGLLAAGSAQAYQAGDIIVRAGAVTVDPNESSDHVSLAGSGLADEGWEVGVDSDTQLGLSATWMMTDSFALSLLAATPFQHNLYGSGSLPKAADLGSTKHLPPTLTLQYYPLHSSHKIQPYIGVGVNYTIFFEEETSDTLTGAVDNYLGGGVVSSTDMDLDDSFGVAAEIGVDIRLSDQFGINAGVWYADIDTTADINAYGANGDKLGTAKVDVEIDPMVYMVGFTYSF
ncbi:outer membrane beta-barrel protein [Marinobacter bryozoorum]|uniref:OmpW/AlkL family protein n=1 Tax=Marinobacter bryozoorum TaxID=256324 RepID=UPI002005B95A|nr:OmpW family outer membrane protein [Marinobacter bryozoorum]MCK7545683.1 outer membrane beta-barrel protein [Marinobacter bryozoorum]